MFELRDRELTIPAYVVTDLEMVICLTDELILNNGLDLLSSMLVSDKIFKKYQPTQTNINRLIKFISLWNQSDMCTLNYKEESELLVLNQKMLIELWTQLFDKQDKLSIINSFHQTLIYRPTLEFAPYDEYENIFRAVSNDNHIVGDFLFDDKEVDVSTIPEDEEYDGDFSSDHELVMVLKLALASKF